MGIGSVMVSPDSAERGLNASPPPTSKVTIKMGTVVTDVVVMVEETVVVSVKEVVVSVKEVVVVTDKVVGVVIVENQSQPANAKTHTVNNNANNHFFFMKASICYLVIFFSKKIFVQKPKRQTLRIGL
jgi:hypothetical protein